MATGQTLTQQELLRISSEHLNGQIIFSVMVHLTLEVKGICEVSSSIARHFFFEAGFLTEPGAC